MDSKLLAITSMNATNPTPTCWMKYGMSPIIELSATVRPAAPAAPAAARAVMPVARAKTPTPARATPAPSSMMAAPNPSNTGTTGASTRPATPRTANTPTSMRRDVPICSRLIFAKVMRTGARMVRAAAITNSAAAPGRALVIRYMLPAITRSDPPSMMRDRPISSIERFPNFSSASPKMRSAGAIMRRANAPGRALVMNFIAAAMMTRDPPMARRPLPIVVNGRLPIEVRALERISIAAPIATIPTPTPTIPFAPPVTAVNPARTPRRTVIAPVPLARDPRSSAANCVTAEARTFIPAASSRSPAPV